MDQTAGRGIAFARRPLMPAVSPRITMERETRLARWLLRRLWLPYSNAAPEWRPGATGEVGGQRCPVRHTDVADGNPRACVHLRRTAESGVLPYDRHERRFSRRWAAWRRPGPHRDV